MGRMMPMRAMKGLAGSDGLDKLESIEDQQDVEEKRRKNWTHTVGADRAERALQMSKGTLPERLAEVWLRAANVQYRAQVVLNGARPDFVLFGVAGDGCVVWRIQGDYWHTLPGKESYDSAQVGALLSDSVDGQRIVAVFDIWEKDIYEGDSVFEKALNDGRTGSNRDRFR